MITSGDDLDLNEQKAFLATYSSFTTSEVLLTKIIGLVRTLLQTFAIGLRIAYVRHALRSSSTTGSLKERSDTKRSESRARAEMRRPPKRLDVRSLCVSAPCPSRSSTICSPMALVFKCFSYDPSEPDFDETLGARGRRRRRFVRGKLFVGRASASLHAAQAGSDHQHVRGRDQTRERFT
jgi:hypothetical protein